jgi:hypothetical protein
MFSSTDVDYKDAVASLLNQTLTYAIMSSINVERMKRRQVIMEIKKAMCRAVISGSFKQRAILVLYNYFPSLLVILENIYRK